MKINLDAPFLRMLDPAMRQRIASGAIWSIVGAGFASGLATTGLPRGEIPLALLLFNVGVEIGQLGFVCLVLLLERSFRQLEIRWPVWVAHAPGYLVGSLGAFWTIQRAAMIVGLSQ